MARSVPEWVGASDDAKVPDRVRLRVLLYYGGRCYYCTRKLYAGKPWACDHIVALINGGEHREKNLAPICDLCHKLKTGEDVAAKSKTYKTQLKHYGVKKSRNPMPGSKASKWKRRMDGTVVRRD